ncbi:MAG: ABC transporter ATP-binding protein [Scytolyngbya sp. HA4215-MV1]|jgi:ABC-2 type transport system ATP-binding protein|nr:ABC transporter ATP-binding protein [Scytolyngbya sp. HA4215-MV1]
MIEVEHLSKSYGSTRAIEDVTFSVEPGEILGFLGPNGAGKTTTMRILSGYLPANEGTAKVAGFEVHENSMAVRKRIGYLPETPPLYPDMTVEGFLHFVARIKGVSAGDRIRQVDSALQRCNLTEKRKVLIRKLSKGFRQRVGIAQAIVHDPPAIILDEPTVGLDPRQIIEVRNLIKNLAGSHTVILSTHILPEASMTCNRIAIINKGRIVATNSPENLVEQLSGGAGYDLEVAGDASTIQQTLQSLPHVKEIAPLPLESETSHLRFRVTLQPGADLGQEIAARIVGAGIGLYEMRRFQVSLEDVFLQLTTEERSLEAADTDTDAEVDSTAESANSVESSDEGETA